MDWQSILNSGVVESNGEEVVAQAGMEVDLMKPE